MSLLPKTSHELTPFRSLLTDLVEVDKFFGQSPWFAGPKKTPSANIKEKADSYEIALAVPGMEKKDFRVELSNNVLTVSAARKEEKKEEKENYTRQEFTYDSFSRSFELPTSVNADAIDAQYKEGILSLHLPKKKEAIDLARKEIAVA
ncbi:Hsp20/alpha crystallin family protein [Rufibacter ruber]|uniref:Hsp20/alpha crystallin family protein n=1 Tax=Rufibacter ruber TaxID=1783499 RepID=UPI00082CE239|nr:Hsp20/alpha crystallin family protein [Rufibacter ruber]